MIRARVDTETNEVLCPTCNSPKPTIFRRDRLTDKIFLNHCKCENCGQLFIYHANHLNEFVKRK